MVELLTSTQMRAIEQAAIDSDQVTGLELMERAGRGVFDAIFEEWPELAKTPHRAMILCGPGNNGGDGFVVARLLKEWGWAVDVFLYGDPQKLPADAKVNYDRWCDQGQVTKYSSEVCCNMLLGHDAPHLIIDAFFGIGLARALPSEIIEFIDEANEERTTGSAPLCVSIDIPTGICTDSGKSLTCAFVADLTVSFHCAKLGHFLSNGPACAGKLIVVDIGLLREESVGLERYSGTARKTAPNAERLSKGFPLSSQLHKYSHGHALVFSGPSFRTGAARLAAQGALRIGAGVVTVCAEREAIPALSAHLTAIMIDEVQGSDDITIKYGSDKRITALCAGPALGLDDRAYEIVKGILQLKCPTVLDADALTLLSQNAELFDQIHDQCVLTPHAGEFNRLFPDIARRLRQEPTSGPAYSKVEATRDAAKLAGCIVLFKGPDTVIASPKGDASINSAHYDRTTPWLATAGSGDVLAGFITGLMARGFSPRLAAENAAWLHAECALQFGPGLIAEDLPEQLPKVLRSILSH